MSFLPQIPLDGGKAASMAEKVFFLGITSRRSEGNRAAASMKEQEHRVNERPMYCLHNWASLCKTQEDFMCKTQKNLFTRFAGKAAQRQYFQVIFKPKKVWLITCFSPPPPAPSPCYLQFVVHKEECGEDHCRLWYSVPLRALSDGYLAAPEGCTEKYFKGIIGDCQRLFSAIWMFLEHVAMHLCMCMGRN